MDVEQRCVWDYVGDNYVHRLIQNKADGKIVAVQGQGGFFAISYWWVFCYFFAGAGVKFFKFKKVID